MDDDTLIIKLNTLSDKLADVDPENEDAGICADAAERISELLGEVEDADEAINEANRERDALEADREYAEDLFSAVVERRTEDAIEIMRKVFDTPFMGARQYQSLFPERIK